jgi:hypothetical protein
MAVGSYYYLSINRVYDFLYFDSFFQERINDQILSINNFEFAVLAESLT